MWSSLWPRAENEEQSRAEVLLLSDFEIGLHHIQGEDSQMFLSLISKMDIQDLKIMLYHELQDIIMIIVLEGAIQH